MARLRSDSTVNTLIIAAVAAIGIAYFVPRHLAGAPGAATATTAVSTLDRNAPAQPRAIWAASAPGRVEPKGGEIRISPQMPGRIAEVLVGVNDKVLPGDLLVRLDDADLEARAAAADAEVAARRRERDAETVTGLARDRRTAEDAASVAERNVVQWRSEYDRLARARRAGTATPEDLAKARDAYTASRDRLEVARTTLRRVLANDAAPLQTRLESNLAAGRAEYSLADAALERARIRAHKGSTVLQVLATSGESVAPSPENVLLIVGDISGLRVRAEIEERDAAKISIGQAAVIRTDAFPGRDFEGKVVQTALALTAGRLSAKGPRKPTDVDVLDVIIDLDGQPALLPGMRVDVFLKPDATAAAEPKKTN